MFALLQGFEDDTVPIVPVVIVDCYEPIVGFLHDIGFDRLGKRVAIIVDLLVEVPYLRQSRLPVAWILCQHCRYRLRSHLMNQPARPRQRHQGLQLHVLNVVGVVA